MPLLQPLVILFKFEIQANRTMIVVTIRFKLYANTDCSCYPKGPSRLLPWSTRYWYIMAWVTVALLSNKWP